VNAYKGKAGMV